MNAQAAAPSLPLPPDAAPAPAPAPSAWRRGIAAIPKLFWRVLDDLTHIDTRSDAALHGPRMTMLAVTALLVVFLAWAALFTIDELVRGEGKLIPPQRVQSVQNLEGGIVAAVLVREGDTVRQGQALVVLDRTTAQADLAESQGPYLSSLAALTRLQAELEGRAVRFPAELDKHDDIRQNELKAFEASRQEIGNTLDALDQQAEQRKQALERARSELATKRRDAQLISDEMAILRPLVPAVVPRSEWLTKEREWLAVRGAIESLQHQAAEQMGALRQVQAERERSLATHRSRLLKEAGEHQTQVTVRAARSAARQAQISRTEVVAPADGVVKQIHVRTVGQVVSPAGVLLDLVPQSDQLTVEARITPADVGFVQVGQPVKVKVATYDFAVYGAMDGVVESISADTLQDRENAQAPPYYRVNVAVQAALQGKDGNALPLTPGMTVSVDIVTGRKTVLTYLFKPLVRGMNQAMGEK
ncbi:HlyD family type I secretion periplasmic adaptor subunit [Hydrogenophaga sp.]|uniref:HlyD family type I secretion periplasmic adaptor subunit n=1 Tax=Hydrogenophaga sp. TaxID=1904254 RepID=UPI002FCBA243